MARTYWTALETKQASSRDAVIHVGAQGFTLYHPKFREQSLGGVRKVRALFQNYMFVKVDPLDESWHKLAHTRGVHRLFMMGDLPARIRDLDVYWLQAHEDALGYFTVPENEPPRFARNQIVSGTRGLFEDKAGYYQGLGRKRDTARVLFEILGRAVEFEVSAHDLVAHAA